MEGLTLLITTAAIGFLASKALRVPVLPLLMLCGALLSPVGQILPAETRSGAVELGVTFLAFTVGLELNPQRFGGQKRAVVWVGLLQMVVAAALGYGFAIAFGFEPITALYVALAVSASSTLVVLRHLKQQHQLFEPFGRLVIGVLLLQDVIMIVIIAVLSRLAEGVVAVAIGVMTVVLLGVMALVSQRFLVPLLVIRWKLDEETLLLSVLALLFMFAGVAFAVGLPPITGAFLAGFALSAFPVNGVVRGLISSLSDFFLALFFVALGTLLSVPSPVYLVFALVFTAVVVVVTAPLVTAIAERLGLSARASIESGLLLAQVSEFSLVALLTGVALGHVPPAVFSVLALTTVLTMTLTPFLATDKVTGALLRLHPFRRRISEPIDAKGHVLLLGFGSGGMWVIRPLMAQGYAIIVVDDDPLVIEQLVRQKISCIRGDGSDERLLERVGARRAALIIASMRRAEDSIKVVRIAKGVPVVVRVFEKADADRVRELGGIPILNSVAAAETFIDWFNTTGLAKTQSEVASATT